MRQNAPGMRVSHTFAYSDPRNSVWIYFLYINWLKELSLPGYPNRLAVTLSSLLKHNELV